MNGMDRNPFADRPMVKAEMGRHLLRAAIAAAIMLNDKLLE